MTGYGRGEASKAGITASVEVKSVNSRFLEVTSRFPRSLSQREKEVKDIVRTVLSRGTVNVSIKTDLPKSKESKLRINVDAAKQVHRLLSDLKTKTKIKEEITLEHLLRFSEIMEPAEEEPTDEKEWVLAEQALKKALKELNDMRAREGRELAKDLKARVEGIGRTLETIDKLTQQRIPEERKRLQDRIAQLVSDPKIIDNNRLELEIAILSEKLDVTEECVRFRSHNKMFLSALNDTEPAGRKLNFVIQEMNREANTIGSKVNDASIAHMVVGIKEELERIREQIQNIE